ncbi:MAG TPA: DUF5916 domain-containing protein, partial [Longimicrobium sp.]|nr:DUF5916 domain-containing protein [Longimicrobium sp.]
VFVLVASALALGPGGAAAQALPRSAEVLGTGIRRVEAARLGGKVEVDGRLDEAAWAAAQPAAAFVQLEPRPGEAATEATEARVLYDDEAIYIGIRGHDRGRISTRLGRRDMELGDSDWFGVVIDSYHDHQTAFSFDVNPSGVRRDATKTDNGDDLSWDAVWEAEAHVDSAGWSAEYRIPFSQLRFNPRESTWGIQVERIIGRRNEYSVLSFTPKSERGGIARYGHLEGLTAVRTGKRLELLPYTVAKAEYIDPGLNPFRTDQEYGASVGLDLKYRLTTDLTLDATINPDFGQVEVDLATVNLSAFETVFQEKRPFFVEGSEIFSFGPGQLAAGGGLFYSRRIGGRFSPVGPGVPSADLPRETDILAAAKLSGKTAGGWSLGFLDAVTAREEARFVTGDGEQEMVVEPMTNFFVGRLRRDLRSGQSYVGAMVTSVNRNLESDALSAALPSSALTAGVDFRHQFAQRQWVLMGFLSGSLVTGDSLAIARVQRFPWHYFQRPDAEHLEVDTDARSLSGLSAELELRKQAGKHWLGSIEAATVSPGYEISDLGSQRRGDRYDVAGSLSYREQTPGKLLRYWSLSTNARREWNHDGDHIYTSLFLGAFWQNLSYWSGNLNVGYTPRGFDDRLTRGGPLAIRPSNWRVFASVDTDYRKPLTGYGGVYYEKNDEDGSFTEVNGGVQVKTSPRWNLSVGPYFSRSANAVQYITTVSDDTPEALFGRRYVFAPLDQTTFALETRFNYTFNPELTLEVYAQPYLSSVDFGASRYLTAPRTFDFAPDTESGVEAPDFNFRSLRGNAVMRWEWRPGSTLYLAWQQQRESFGEEGDFRLGRDRRELFDAEPDNVFLIKVSYWLNP